VFWHFAYSKSIVIGVQQYLQALKLLGSKSPEIPYTKIREGEFIPKLKKNKSQKSEDERQNIQDNVENLKITIIQ